MSDIPKGHGVSINGSFLFGTGSIWLVKYDTAKIKKVVQDKYGKNMGLTFCI